MGFEDRQYTRDDSMYGGSGGGGNAGLGQYSIVAILIAINFIVWIADMFLQTEGANSGWPNYLLSLDVEKPWRIWTFLTYGFTHAPIKSNLFHIIFNMFVLFMFGRPVAHRLGRYEFLRFYLVAIVFSGLAFYLWNVLAGSRASIVGASGATTAVLILFILWYPNQKLFLMGIVEVPAWLLGIGLVGYDLLRAFNPESEVAWQAHLAGAGFAYLYLHFKWNFSWMSSLTGWIPQSKSKFGVYNPDADTGPAKPDRLSEEGDRILEKISKQGEDSLTRKERKTLERYSKSMRNRK